MAAPSPKEKSSDQNHEVVPRTRSGLHKGLSIIDNQLKDHDHDGSQAQKLREKTALSIDFTKADADGCYQEPIVFPQSTHSLLFTEPVCSIPFLFAVFIVLMSLSCLVLALADNLSDTAPGNPLGVPVQVDSSVRGAQYLSLIIGLIMEEEIPTGLYQLRMISKEELRRKFPDIKFETFVLSTLVRLIIGYIYIFNMFLVIAQASGVLDIFYDMLALQFIQQLDDIAFSLAKIDVFGKHLKRASTDLCFQQEFEKLPFRLRKKMNIFLKSLYFLNMCALLGGMVYISMSQTRGDYHCKEIFVVFGDDIWEDALVMESSGIEEKVLLYSYFNGLYRRNGTENGLPVYVEQDKFDGSSFEVTVPAKIKYCSSEKAWVFMHDNIRKSKESKEDCPWLLRKSSNEYNILDVQGDEWTVWAGTFHSGGRVLITCDKCIDEADCNFRGMCVEGKCVCSAEENFVGNHCEHKKPCPKIIGDYGDKWDLVVDKQRGDIVPIYDRPAFLYVSGFETSPNNMIEQDDLVLLLYSGSRWFGMVFESGRNSTIYDDSYWNQYSKEYHAFWKEAYTNLTKIVSGPTKESTPISVDFFQIGDRGERFGPFGELYPMRLPVGSGYFQCDNNESQSIEVNTTESTL